MAILGFGIVNYTDILWMLICVFFLFSLILTPTMHIFHKGTGYANVAENAQAYEQGMLGNLGFSSVQCAKIPLDVGKLNLQCPFGTIGKLIDTGVNIQASHANNCVTHEEYAPKKCKPDSEAFWNEINQAIGKESSTLEFTNTGK